MNFVEALASMRYKRFVKQKFTQELFTIINGILYKCEKVEDYDHNLTLSDVMSDDWEIVE